MRIKKSSKRGEAISKSLRSSISCGFEYLTKKVTAVDVVEAAVASLEDSQIFNAGAGSSLTCDKQIEMDAGIMNGKGISAGAVGMVQYTRNPVKLARLVMERMDHVMIVSEVTTELSRAFGNKIQYLKPNPESIRTYNHLYKDMKKEWKKNYKLLSSAATTVDYGNVGAVAIDREGNVASAVSTGGRWLKLHGRIGDSAVVGGGFYADNECGAYITRLCLCKYACDQMKERHNISLVSQDIIALLTRWFGSNTGGLILVNRRAQFATAMNTESMPTALLTSKMKRIKITLNKDEIHYSL